jgi:hypothetical protein
MFLFQVPPRPTVQSGNCSLTTFTPKRTATDDAGNLNNIMTAPGPESSLKPRPLAHLQEAERQRLSSTPIGQVADTAAEVADTAEKLDGDKPDDTVPEVRTVTPRHAPVPPADPALVPPRRPLANPKILKACLSS